MQWLTWGPANIIQLSIISTSEAFCPFSESTFVFFCEECWVVSLVKVALDNAETEYFIAVPWSWMLVIRKLKTLSMVSSWVETLFYPSSFYTMIGRFWHYCMGSHTKRYFPRAKSASSKGGPKSQWEAHNMGPHSNGGPKSLWHLSASILLADSILRHKNDLSLVQVFRPKKSLAVMMMYDLSTLVEHLTLFRTLATHGKWLPDGLRLFPLREVSSRNECVNQKRAMRNKAKMFVMKDGILHYVAKEWMHIHVHKSSHNSTLL